MRTAPWLLPVSSESSCSVQYERSPSTLWYVAIRRSVRDLRNAPNAPAKNHSEMNPRINAPAGSPGSKAENAHAAKMPAGSIRPPASLSAPFAFFA